MVSRAEKGILEYKKDIFIKEVSKASISLGVPVPEIKFWNHYENHFDKGERAHIHLEEGIICIAEPELEIMSEEDIRKTATHEVSHLHYSGHGLEFQNTHQDLEIASWEPPAGTIGALPEGYKPSIEKERKQRTIKYKCNLCDKKGETKKCKHCGGYFCEKHITPQEAVVGIETPRYRTLKENTHPCFPYTQYLIKQEKKQAEEYSKALDNLLKKKTKDYEKEEPEIKEDSEEIQKEEKIEEENEEKNNPLKKFMNRKCFLFFHKYQKFKGLSNIGSGKFLQRYKCEKCGKIKEVIK